VAHHCSPLLLRILPDPMRSASGRELARSGRTIRPNEHSGSAHQQPAKGGKREGYGPGEPESRRKSSHARTCGERDGADRSSGEQDDTQGGCEVVSVNAPEHIPAPRSRGINPRQHRSSGKEKGIDGRARQRGFALTDWAARRVGGAEISTVTATVLAR
jgi:hypothetical protein